MVEPMITTGAALVGTAAWFADKLLGSSADALGEHIKIYAGERWNKIFSKASVFAEGKGLQPLPPAFAYQALQKASFSEDAEILTEMWARLLVDAGSKYKSRHALFVDILGTMTSLDAKLFSLMWENRSNPDIEDVARLSQYVQSLGIVTSERVVAEASSLQIMQTSLGFEGYIINVGVPYQVYGDPTLKHADHLAYQKSGFESEADALVRNGLARPFRISFGDSFLNPQLEGVIVTELGKEFYAACGAQQ